MQFSNATSHQQPSCCAAKIYFIPVLSNSSSQSYPTGTPKSLDPHVKITPVSAPCPNAGSAKETGGQSHGNKQAKRGQSPQRNQEHRTKNRSRQANQQSERMEARLGSKEHTLLAHAPRRPQRLPRDAQRSDEVLAASR